PPRSFFSILPREGGDDGKSYRGGRSGQELLEGTERGSGPARGGSGGRTGRDGRRGGGQRVRQEHPPAHPWPARRPRRGDGPGGFPAHRQPSGTSSGFDAQPIVRLHLPVLSPASRADRAGERDDAQPDPARRVGLLE